MLILAMLHFHFVMETLPEDRLKTPQAGWQSSYAPLTPSAPLPKVQKASPNHSAARHRERGPHPGCHPGDESSAGPSQHTQVPSVDLMNT